MDSHLRGQSNTGVGLILNPETMRPTALARTLLSRCATSERRRDHACLNIEALRLVFDAGQGACRGRMVVDFVKGNDGYTGVLHVPGKDALLVAGADQVRPWSDLWRHIETAALWFGPAT